MKKKTKITLAVCLTLIVALVGGYFAYVADYYHASETAVAAMSVQTNGIEINKDGNVTYFIPDDPTAALIFYPGGKVQCEAYAPLMRACAEKGILCALVKMPENLAVLNPNAANGIKENYPQIENWYIGGHSLGGAMAANYAAENSEEYSGIILLAAYCTKDISQTDLKVLSIYGSEDGVLNKDSYEKNKSNLPNNFTETVIDGGCHAYFGDYGAQDGDGTPTISNSEQIIKTADEIYEFTAK